MRIKSRLLILEQDSEYMETLQTALENARFEVNIVSEPFMFMAEAVKVKYQALLIQSQGNETSAFALCSRLRARGVETPILMLLSSYRDPEVIRALNAGADAYLAPPYSMSALVMRLRVLLHRAPRSQVEEVTVGEIAINKSLREVNVRGKYMNVQRREFDILLMLAENKGRIIRRQLLNDATSSGARVAGDATVDVHISRLRKKLVGYGCNKNTIETVYGVGYRMR